MTIVKDQDIRFGKPTVQGTRIAVKDVVETFYDAGRSVKEIAEDYQIEEKEVEEALRYHRNREKDEVTA